jgi:hypothetical protein
MINIREVEIRNVFATCTPYLSSICKDAKCAHEVRGTSSPKLDSLSQQEFCLAHRCQSRLPNHGADGYEVQAEVRPGYCSADEDDYGRGY